MDNATPESHTTEEQAITAPEQPETVGELVPQPQRKSRFVNTQDVITVDLGDGDWVKVQKRIPYSFLEKFQQGDIAGKQGIEQTTEMLARLIIEWNLVDENGNIAMINTDSIRTLELSAVTTIISAIPDIANVPKDDSTPSSAQSGVEESTQQ